MTKTDILLSRSTSVTDKQTNAVPKHTRHTHGHRRSDPEMFALRRTHAALNDLSSLYAENINIQTTYTVVTAEVPS